MQRVENTIVGNRQFMEAIINDLRMHFKKPNYTPKDSIEVVMYKEGNQKVIDYLERKFSS